MRMSWVLAIGLVVGCGDGGAGGADATLRACTPEGMGVTGTTLTFTTIWDIDRSSGSCDRMLLTSAADVAAAYGAVTPPPEVANANFAVDRVVLASTNPQVMFVVDTGTEIVVGQELLCQGAAPTCTAHVVAGTARNTLRVDACPYRGPDPCLAP